MKYQIGDKVKDEDGHIGYVVIKWDDGDICYWENDAAHPNPEKIGNLHKKARDNGGASSENRTKENQ